MRRYVAVEDSVGKTRQCSLDGLHPAFVGALARLGDPLPSLTSQEAARFDPATSPRFISNPYIGPATVSLTRPRLFRAAEVIEVQTDPRPLNAGMFAIRVKDKRIQTPWSLYCTLLMAIDMRFPEKHESLRIAVHRLLDVDGAWPWLRTVSIRLNPSNASELVDKRDRFQDEIMTRLARVVTLASDLSHDNGTVLKVECEQSIDVLQRMTREFNGLLEANVQEGQRISGTATDLYVAASKLLIKVAEDLAVAERARMARERRGQRFFAGGNGGCGERAECHRTIIPPAGPKREHAPAPKPSLPVTTESLIAGAGLKFQEPSSPWQ